MFKLGLIMLIMMSLRNMMLWLIMLKVISKNDHALYYAKGVIFILSCVIYRAVSDI